MSPYRPESFPELSPEIRERLKQRGIDPETSARLWLEAIRDGRFPITVEGLPARPPRPGAKPGQVGVPSPIPMAVVIP